MENLYDVKAIKHILKEHGFRFSKKLGQNFITESFVCEQMALEASGENNNVGILEIGPGIGALTKELSLRAKKVVGVEIDKNLIPILKTTLKTSDNVKIINEDIMNINLKEFVKREFFDCGISKVNVCANLPYYITSPIIMHLLESGADINSIVVMVQKEAAQRMCAQEGSRESGAVSMAIKYYSHPEILFEVGRESFIPSPNVDSCVIKLTITDERKKLVTNEKMFFRVVHAAFAKRRKTILNALNAGLCMSKDEILNILDKLNIDPMIRAERLSFVDFVGLSEMFYAENVKL